MALVPDPRMFVEWRQWAERLVAELRFGPGGSTSATLPSFTIANLPAASGARGLMVFVEDDIGGPVPAFSDGLVWRRVTDRAEVSTI